MRPPHHRRTRAPPILSPVVKKSVVYNSRYIYCTLLVFPSISPSYSLTSVAVSGGKTALVPLLLLQAFPPSLLSSFPFELPSSSGGEKGDIGGKSGGWREKSVQKSPSQMKMHLVSARKGVSKITYSYLFSICYACAAIA